MVFRMGQIQERFTTSEEIYRDLIPHYHILYQIYEKVDFSFVNDECRELYCEDPVVHEPVKLFRAAIVQYFYGLSDRGTEEGVNYNLVYRWFVGYQLKGDNDVSSTTLPLASSGNAWDTRSSTPSSIVSSTRS